MPTRNTPAETAGVAHSLCFRQIGLTPQQRLLDALTLQYFLCQLPVDGPQLAGPLQDTFFKFLIQALDLSLSLFVPGGLDNVPTSAPPCHCKLMCSHYIQDFSSSACGKRVRA